MSQVKYSSMFGTISNSMLILGGFATVFYPRILVYFGFPQQINFIHFLFIPCIFFNAILTTNTRNKHQVLIVWKIIFGLLFYLSCNIMSAIVNGAGVINVFLQYMLQAEPFLFLIALISIPLTGARLAKFRKYFMGFGLTNLVLAIAQSVLIPIGLFPKSDQLYADNIAGVFSARGGSAGNYISCTVSIYFSLYFLIAFKKVPICIRFIVLAASLYQTFISDSKQIFFAFLVAWIVYAITNTKKPEKLFAFILFSIVLVAVFILVLQHTELEFLHPYRNWTVKRDFEDLYGPNGIATETKLAAFRIIPSYYKSALNYFFGLGPGHTVTRLGGWMLKRYASILVPLGATLHPASKDVFDVVTDGWIAQQSTIFFPLFTWAGIWGDLGIIGLGSYLYLGSIVWRNFCVDNLCKYIILTNIVLGFIITQMEEPGQMVTVACILGLRWHEEQEKNKATYFILQNE